MADPDTLGYAIMGGLGAAAVYSYGDLVLYAFGRTRTHRQALRRARRAELAAAEACDDTPAFAPSHVRAEVELMLQLVERAWATAEDTLAARPDRDALSRWARSMAWIPGRPRLRGLREARLVHVVNREGDAEDRVDVWVRVRLGPRDSWLVDRWLSIRTFDQHWTLGRRGERWELLAFRDAVPRGTTIRRRLIAMPWADHDRLYGESLREMAAEEPVAIGHSSRYRDAAVRARDLALVDARYSEPVIESVLLRLVEAWEQAALGRPQLLRHVASQRAGDALRRKVALDGLELRTWRIMHLDDRREPVQMSLDVELSGANDLRWVLEACPGDDPLWRLIATSDPNRPAGG